MKKITKKQMIGLTAAAAVFVAAIVILIAVFAGKTEESYRSIKIVEMNGKVTIGREGIGDLDAAVNMNLISGDSVHTGQDAYVVLMLDTDKYVMLGESGSMKVTAEGDENSGRTSILLEQGSVLSEIQNPLGQGSSYDVVTPNATMSVRGTVFEIDRKADGTVSLLVYDGAVALGLDGQEPVLYSAGEYMQFEEGNPPEITVDREPISEEVMNEQMQKRLEEINESGRELNVGSVQLAENSASSESGAASGEGTGTAAPTAEPESTETPEPTATPESTATPEPTETPKATATPKPRRTPKPAATPTPEPTPEPTWQPEWQEPSWQPAPTPVPGYTVTFVNPCVWVNNTTLVNLSDLNGKNGSPRSEWVEQGKTLTAPAETYFIPVISDGSSRSLKLAGWYREDGTKWDFEKDTVTGDLTLYPVWVETVADVSGGDVSGGDVSGNNAGGTTEIRYWPVIFKGVSWGQDRYVCLPEGTSDMPRQDLSGMAAGVWEKVYEAIATKKLWDASQDSVSGVITLKITEITPPPTM